MRLQKSWTETWYGMAGGDAVQYGCVKGMEVGEFFRVLRVYNENLKQKVEAAKRNNK